MAITKHRFLDPQGPAPHFAYLGLAEDIGYRDGSELIDRLHEAVAEDVPFIDLKEPRLFWGEAKADTADLTRRLIDDYYALQKLRPDYTNIIQGWGRYAAFGR